MIRVMVIDDEPPALRQAERVLQTFADVQICGLFTDPDEFLKHVQDVPVDLVLLDMEIPGFHGLVIAEKIQSFQPEVSIAFVTAYDEYAVDAFDVEALDYLLKPITEERLAKTLHRFYRRKQRSTGRGDRIETGSGPTLSIRCFGRLALTTEQGKVNFINSKSEELLAYLIHHNGEPVDKAQIMEELWPNRDLARAKANLYSTVYQLRKDLEVHGLRDCIEQSKGRGGIYRLRLALDKSDVYVFEQTHSICKNDRFDQRLAERAIDLYKCGYLQEHDYDWAVQRHKDLEARYEELLDMVVNDHVYNKRYRQAVPLVQKWADLFPYNEHVHAKMIALYILLNQIERARMYFAKVGKEMYKDELGLAFEVDFERIKTNPFAVFE